jgi:UPF0755 protein
MRRRGFRRLVHYPKFWIIAFAILFVVLVGVVGSLRIWYTNNLKPVSSSQKITYFTVENGDTKHQIAVKLQRDKLIKSSKAFETYLRGNEVQILQAGTYGLSPSMSVQKIVEKMVEGQVTRNLLTILPGKRVDEIRKTFSKAGYSEDVINNAFDPDTYADLPLMSYIPNGQSLEGFLYPDSFAQQANTPATDIVRESLNEMQSKLTTDVINGFVAQGLNPYQGVTLASIVYQESDDPEAQSTIAQVFLSRIKQDMALQSNVTANYAADLAGVARNVNIDSPYNTYFHKGLTPGPIGNVTQAALSAVAHPANTNYLYFVAGDDGKIHFSSTAEEHRSLIKQYCTKLCAQE